MNALLKIGIIGDYDPKRESHAVTVKALDHSARALAVDLDSVWLHTDQLETETGSTSLKAYDAFLCGPGSPYTSMSGALKAIQFCREKDRPFIGT